jgi:(1->4)-alpha-D-glucan 1-alpha-D-glucosylmutase
MTHHDEPADESARRRRHPTASLRLQLTPTFGFDAAAARLDAIARLGVSHVYLSPIAEAVPGSGHGYDVTDHTRIRADFGGSERFEPLLDAAADRGLGIIVDHVPNHVSVERAELNAPWWATLRDGPNAPEAAWFDIDWKLADGRVIIPRLGAPLTDLLAAGEITTGVGDLGPEVRVHGLRFPLAAGTEELELAHALDQQHYRLAHWRDPARNVRRFFTIDDLVAVRVEDHDVAREVDTIPSRLSGHPAFAGVRVDHVDGLAAPGEYLRGLRDVIGDDRLLFVEKIVAPGERIPAHWPVDGTTGYEHVDVTEHTLLDPAAEATLGRVWSRWAPGLSFEQVERSARAEVLAAGLDPDFARLAAEAVETTPAAPDQLRQGIDALTLAIERYRTYLPDDPTSQEVFDDVVTTATNADGSDADFVATVAGLVRDTPNLLQRWQQLTGPAVAKGGEDRAFYRWFPLASLCEVGGDPGRFSTSIAAFHEAQVTRQLEYPSAMLAETTHDTKRSAGVRARSLALAARSLEWEAVVDQWLAANTEITDALGEELGGGIVHLALQTSVTAQPIDAHRLGEYLVKSAREADLLTTWTEPDDHVESTLRRLAASLVADATTGPLAPFARVIEREGDAVGMAMLALHLTCPGFADLYQGSPTRLLSLVDPDNRAPVDWDTLDALIDQIPTTDSVTAFARGDIDLARTVLTQRILRLRQRRPEAFDASAGYVQLEVSGPDSQHVIAFARTDGDGEPLVVVITTRAVADVSFVDSHVELPSGTWRSIMIDDARTIDGGRRRFADIVAQPDGQPPVVVLERTDR